MTPVLEAISLPLAVDAHGSIRVGGTRVTLDTVVDSFNAGSTVEQIVQDYDVLSLPDVYAAITYYLNHRSEVDRYLDERKRQADEIRREIEAHSAWPAFAIVS